MASPCRHGLQPHLTPFPRTLCGVVADAATSGSRPFKAIPHLVGGRLQRCRGNTADSITAYIDGGAPSAFFYARGRVLFVRSVGQVEQVDRTD